MRRNLDLRNVLSKIGLGIILCSLGAIILFNALGVQSGPTYSVEVTEGEEIVIHEVQPAFEPGILVVPVVLMVCGALLGVVGGMQYQKKHEIREDGEEALPETPQPEKESLPPETAQKKREELAHLLEAGLLTKEEYRERLKKLE